jgi:hypothetical protein
VIQRRATDFLMSAAGKGDGAQEQYNQFEHGLIVSGAEREINAGPERTEFCRGTGMSGPNGRRASAHDTPRRDRDTRILPLVYKRSVRRTVDYRAAETSRAALMQYHRLNLCLSSLRMDRDEWSTRLRFAQPCCDRSEGLAVSADGTIVVGDSDVRLGRRGMTSCRHAPPTLASRISARYQAATVGWP